MIAISLGIMELLSLGIMTNFVPRMMQAGYVDPATHGPAGIIFLMLAIAGIAACFGSVGCGIMDAKLGPKKAIQITDDHRLCGHYPEPDPHHRDQVCISALPGHHAGRCGQLPGLPHQYYLGLLVFPMAYKVLKPMVAAIGALGVSVVGIIGRSVSYSVAYGVLAGLTVIAFILVSCVDDKLIGRN